MTSTVPGPVPPSRPSARSGSLGARPVARPPAIGRALVVALLQVPVSLLGLVLLLSDASAVSSIADLLYGEDGITTSGNTAEGLAMILSLVTFLVVNAVWLWLTARMWAGRSWARTIMTVLGVLTVFSLFATLPSGDATTTLPSVLSAGLAAALVVFLCRPESTRWFGAQ